MTTTTTKASWSYLCRPVPDHEDWVYRIGLGGPCWSAWLKSDTYTSVSIDQGGEVTTRNAPESVVQWLLDSHPPLDSWVKPTEGQVREAWASERK